MKTKVSHSFRQRISSCGDTIDSVKPSQEKTQEFQRIPQTARTDTQDL